MKLIILILICIPSICFTQIQKYTGSEFQFNMNQLITQIIPFQPISDRAGPYTLNSIRYWRNKGIRFSLGIDATAFKADGLESFAMNGYLAYAIRKPINEKFTYNYGYGISFFTGTVNETLFFDNRFEESPISGGFGFGSHHGVAYNINDFLSLGFETNLILGIEFNFGLPVFLFVPPTTLSLHVRIAKN